jgi:hypothetical protein
MNEDEARIHFQMESGQRQSDRLVQDCLDGLTMLLHKQYVQVNGKGYPVKVVAADGRIMFDIRGLPGFDHIEFIIEKTGWGRGV